MMRRTALRPDDLGIIARNLRKQDADELSVTGHSPIHSLYEAAAVSAWVDVLRVGEDSPACVFGLRVMEDGTGIPWMIGTPLVSANPKAFMRYSHDVVAEMLRQCPRLINLVDARNTTSIRWLRRLGFTVESNNPHPVNGYTFYPFHKSCAYQQQLR